MNELRNELKEKSPELYQAFEHSWNKALNEWLPALKSEDSYNSFPHFRNMENHLDRIILLIEKFYKSYDIHFELTAPEIYLILSSILFHDIGRILGKENHGFKSKNIIHKNFGELGVPSRELAQSLEKLCEYHDSVELSTQDKQLPTMSIVHIDPYGKVREQELASLLVLIDHMDSSFVRVVPEYIIPDEKTQAVGTFRRNIRGVYFDPDAQMVCTCLRDIDETNLYGKYEYQFDEYLDKETRKKLPNINLIEKCTYDLIKKNNKIEKIIKLRKDKIEDKVLGNIRLKPIDWLIFLKFITVKKKSENKPWSEEKISALVMHDVMINTQVLRRIRDDLSKIGIHARSWLIEKDEHLYNFVGDETYEPVFHKQSLIDIVKSMWELSVQIISTGYFSYETLASAVRDPNIKKVKKAVHRISILTQPMLDKKSKLKTAVWAGDSSWKWLIDKNLILDTKYKKKKNERNNYV